MSRVMCETDPLCPCMSRKELGTGNDVIPLSVAQEGDFLRIIVKTDLLSCVLLDLSYFCPLI